MDIATPDPSMRSSSPADKLTLVDGVNGQGSDGVDAQLIVLFCCGGRRAFEADGRGERGTLNEGCLQCARVCVCGFVCSSVSVRSQRRRSGMKARSPSKRGEKRPRGQGGQRGARTEQEQVEGGRTQGEGTGQRETGDAPGVKGILRVKGCVEDVSRIPYSGEDGGCPKEREEGGAGGGNFEVRGRLNGKGGGRGERKGGERGRGREGERATGWQTKVAKRGGKGVSSRAINQSDPTRLAMLCHAMQMAPPSSSITNSCEHSADNELQLCPPYREKRQDIPVPIIHVPLQGDSSVAAILQDQVTHQSRLIQLHLPASRTVL